MPLHANCRCSRSPTPAICAVLSASPTTATTACGIIGRGDAAHGGLDRRQHGASGPDQHHRRRANVAPGSGKHSQDLPPPGNRTDHDELQRHSAGRGFRPLPSARRSGCLRDSVVEYAGRRNQPAAARPRSRGRQAAGDRELRAGRRPHDAAKRPDPRRQ